MRKTLTCACGERLSAESDAELLAAVEAHVARVHDPNGAAAAAAPTVAEEER